jgi:hypothetical protein
VFSWNKGKFHKVVLRIEEFVDKISVAKTKMIIASQQFRFAAVIMAQLGKTGRASGCTP